jgi:hypothetical protein
MQSVPRRTSLIVPTLPWVVVSEAVKDSVPDGGIALEKSMLAEWDPDVSHSEVADTKVMDVESWNCRD